MTQEDKEILLKDLCAKLPYGVLCDRLGKPKRLLGVHPTKKFPLEFDNGEYMPSDYGLEDIKPYLRPMSSMTDEEREEWADLFMKPICDLEQYTNKKEAQDMAPLLYAKSHNLSIDWLNKKMFDHRNLIPMGLALEATEGMYK